MRNIPAWREGYKAFCDGKNLVDNPYGSLNVDSAHWHQGWRDAEHDDNHYPAEGR